MALTLSESFFHAKVFIQLCWLHGTEWRGFRTRKDVLLANLQCGIQYLRENGMRVTDRQTGKEGGITLHGRQYQPVQHVTPDGTFSSIQKVLKGKGKVFPLQARCGPEGG